MNHRELNQILVGRAEEIAKHIVPNGKRQGNKWIFGDDPSSGGDSASVYVSGNLVGNWGFWKRGEKGNNFVSLWCKVLCDDDYPKTMTEIKDYLGIDDSEFRVNKPSFKIHRRPTDEEKARVKQIDPRGRVMRYLQDERMLTPEILDKAGVSAPPSDDKYIFPYYDEDGLCMYQAIWLDRIEGKKRIYVTPGAKSVLFGKPMICANVKDILICEGQLDCLSWHQYGIPAVSVPSGVSNQAWVENDWDWLERFETIYIAFDTDEAGKQGAKKLAERLGMERCMNVDISPYKDANQMLTEGEHMVERYIEQATAFMPDEVEGIDADLDNLVYEMTDGVKNPIGIKTPWSGLKFRIRPSEVTAVVGFTGHGKTTAVNNICAHLQSQGINGIIASLEMKSHKVKGAIISALHGTTELTEQQIRDAVYSPVLKDMLFVKKSNGRMTSAEKMLEYFRICARKYGCKYAVLDNMMMCRVKQDDYDGQQYFLEALQALAIETKMHIFLVVHPRKPQPEQEMKGPPSIYEIKGAGEIANLVDNCMVVWRNKKKHIELGRLLKDNEYGQHNQKILDLREKPDGIIGVEKQRDGAGDEDGWIGATEVWRKGRCQFVESRDQPTRNYIEENNLEAMVN